MNLFNSVRACFSQQHKNLYSPPKKKPMTEAVAERFLWEVMLTDMWDHLFHQTGWCAEGLKFGPVDEIAGLVSVFSLKKFPRVLASSFVVREVLWRKDCHPGCQEIRFRGKDKNDSITVTLKGAGENWKPVGLQVILLGDSREGNNVLITQYMEVRSKDGVPLM